jgi:hypothetical protein
MKTSLFFDELSYPSIGEAAQKPVDLTAGAKLLQPVLRDIKSKTNQYSNKQNLEPLILLVRPRRCS